MEDTTSWVGDQSPQEGDQSPQEHEQTEQPWEQPQGEDGGLQQQRRRRVQKYHVRALASDDPLKASLGSINAELMHIAMALDRAVNEYLAAGPLSLERIMRHRSAVEVLLKLARQIDRFAQLERRPVGRSKDAEAVGSPPKLPR